MEFNKIGTLLRELSIPIYVAKCVFPTPLNSRNTMFLASSIKLNDAKILICISLICV